MGEGDDEIRRGPQIGGTLGCIVGIPFAIGWAVFTWWSLPYVTRMPWWLFILIIVVVLSAAWGGTFWWIEHG